MKLAASKATTAKILASVVLVGGAASVAGLGTFGAFTSTTTANQAVGSGSIALTTGTPSGGVEIAATNMVPGDVAQRAITLKRGATDESFGTVTLATTSTTNSLLTSSTSMGLQLVVQSCPVAWTPAANNTLTCASPTTVVASRAVIAPSLDLTAATTALNGTSRTAHLMAQLTLPAAADNTLQGKSDAVVFTFTATQRAAKSL